MRRLFFLCLLCAVPAQAATRLALGSGEAFTFRVSAAFFFNAGEIKISAKDETDDNQPCLLVVTTTSTRGMLRAFYPFDARADSVYNLRTGRMVIHTEKSSSGKKKPTDTMLTFDYEHHTADFRDLVRPEKSQLVTLPPGDPAENMQLQSVADVGTFDGRSIAVGPGIAYVANDSGVFEIAAGAPVSLTEKKDSTGIGSYWRSLSKVFTSGSVFALGLFKDLDDQLPVNAPKSPTHS